MSCGNFSPMDVVELVIAAPFRHGKVLSRPDHIACGPIGEDESSLTVNDGKRHTHSVENGLKQRFGLEPQEGRHFLRSCLACPAMACSRPHPATMFRRSISDEQLLGYRGPRVSPRRPTQFLLGGCLPQKP